MLDRLPTELLALIIRHACPLPPLSVTDGAYTERRCNLRAFSLVNRRFRAVAQPLLPEVFVPVRSGEAEVVLDRRVEGARVRDLRLKLGGEIAARGAEIVQACTNTRVVHLEKPLGDRSPGVSLSCMSTLSNLVDLSLHGLSFPEDHEAPLFPSLQTLSLYGTSLLPAALNTLISSTHTPRLRHLALSAVHSIEDRSDSSAAGVASGGVFAIPASVDFLERLDLVIFDARDPLPHGGPSSPSSSSSDSGSTGGPLVLLTCPVLALGNRSLPHRSSSAVGGGLASLCRDLGAASRPFPAHLALEFPTKFADDDDEYDEGDDGVRAQNEREEEEMAEDLLLLARRVSSRSASCGGSPLLRLLFLPSGALTAYGGETVLGCAIREVVRVCEEEGVEIVFEMEEEEEGEAQADRWRWDGAGGWGGGMLTVERREMAARMRVRAGREGRA
ncbi:hypothetical protein JCM6882_001818 [Rhodosporidiobolus microsporus]